MGSDVGAYTYSNEADDLGAYALGDSVVRIDTSKWSPDTMAPKNTDKDDVEGLLAWVGTSCADVLQSLSCNSTLTLRSSGITDIKPWNTLDDVSGGASNSFVYIFCPHSCKSYIDNLV